MKKTIAVVTVMAGILCCGAQDIRAQDSEIMMLPPKKMKEMSFEKKYESCMENSECTLESRLRLMEEMGKELQTMLGRMSGVCAIMNYNECIGPQREERQRWRDMHERMSSMMESMEMRLMPGEREMMSIEPSAGKEGGEEKKERDWWKFFYR